MVKRSQDGPLRGRGVLVAEDDYFVATEVRRTLERVGACPIGPVATVDRARELVNDGDVRAAILDINLRGLKVFDVADALSDDGVPFVFLTGYEADVVPARFGDVLRFRKPCDGTTVVNGLSSVFEKRLN